MLNIIDHIIDHYNMLDHLKPALTEMVYNREDPILIKNLVRKIAQHPDKDKIFSQMFNYLDHYIVDNENIRKSIGTDHFEIALRSKLDFEYVNNREILEKFLYRGHATMEPLVYTHAVLDMADIYFNPHGPQTNIAPALIVKSLTYKDDPRFIALMKKISSIQLTKNHLFDEELFREYVRAMNTHKHRMQPWMLESLQQLLENNKIFSKTQSYSIAKQILPNTSTLSKLCSLIYKVRR